MMKELMDLLYRAVLALESIAKSFRDAGGAGGDVAAGGIGAGPGPVDTRARVEDNRKDPVGKATRRMSDVSDISYISPDIIQRSRAASVEFAIDNQKVPWTEAHMRAVLEFEEAVRREHGDAQVNNLPWNRVIPRGEDAVR